MNDGWVARLTTPAFTYKPSAVDMADVSKIYLVIKQNGVSVIEKDKDDATVTESGFTWVMSQEETQTLMIERSISVQVDYLTDGGLRYTTVPKFYEVTDSAINEVI